MPAAGYSRNATTPLMTNFQGSEAPSRIGLPTRATHQNQSALSKKILAKKENRYILGDSLFALFCGNRISRK